MKTRRQTPSTPRPSCALLSARRLPLRRRRRSRLPLHRNRPSDDVHLQMRPDSARVQSRRLPRLRRHAQRTHGRRQPRRQRQPGRAILRAEIRTHRPRRSHQHRLRPHRLDHALRRARPRLRLRRLRHPRLEKSPRTRRRRRPATRSAAPNSNNSAIRRARKPTYELRTSLLSARHRRRAVLHFLSPSSFTSARRKRVPRICASAKTPSTKICAT